MKVGDYVAKIENKWQQHNQWMDFPDEPPVPLGIIVSSSESREVGKVFDVLKSCGNITSHHHGMLEVISEVNSSKP
jgi:hypothetical protein